MKLKTIISLCICRLEAPVVTASRTGRMMDGMPLGDPEWHGSSSKHLHYGIHNASNLIEEWLLHQAHCSHLCQKWALSLPLSHEMVIAWSTIWPLRLARSSIWVRLLCKTEIFDKSLHHETVVFWRSCTAILFAVCIHHSYDLLKSTVSLHKSKCGSVDEWI